MTPVDRRAAERAVVALLIGDLGLVDPEVRGYLTESGALEGEEIRPVKAAVALVNAGVSPERAAALLDWRGFESLVEEYLEGFDYRVVARRFRFAHGGRRWEVDLIGSGRIAALAVECKLWSRGRGVGARLASEARVHLRRVRALVESGEARRLGLRGRVVPLLVGWVTGVERLVDGVPVVPLYKLNSFLDELDPLDEDLAGFTL